MRTRIFVITVIAIALAGFIVTGCDNGSIPPPEQEHTHDWRLTQAGFHGVAEAAHSHAVQTCADKDCGETLEVPGTCLGTELTENQWKEIAANKTDGWAMPQWRTEIEHLCIPERVIEFVGAHGNAFIGAYAFQNSAALKSVYASGITGINIGAFFGCTALESIDLPAITLINDNAFRDCAALANVELPSITEIRDRAFEGCTALESIDLPKATLIGYRAFANCAALESVNLPLAASIGRSAFEGCTALVSADMPSVTQIGDEAFVATGNGALTITLGDTAPTVGINVFQTISTAKSVTVKFPADALAGYTYVGNANTSAQNWGNAFRGRGWNPGNEAWAGNGYYGNGTVNANISLTLDEVPHTRHRWVPTTLAGFHSAAGHGANGLDTCTECPATRVTTCRGTELSSGATWDVLADNKQANDPLEPWRAGIEHLCVPAGFAGRIGDYAFVGSTNLKSVSIQGAAEIGDRAFQNCTAIASIELPLVTALGISAFLGNTALKSASLPAATQIGSGAFANCAVLESVWAPVATIIGGIPLSGSVFLRCTALANVYLPAVQTIRTMTFAFSGSAPLTITLGAAPPTVEAGLFTGVSAKTVTVKVPAGALASYDEAWQTAFTGGNDNIALTVAE